MCYKEKKQEELQEKFLIKSVNLPRFIKDYFIKIPSGTTKINNLNAIVSFLSWYFSNGADKRGIEDLSPEDLSTVRDIDVIEYFNLIKSGKLNRKLSLASIKTNINVLSGFWKYLVKYEYVRRNIIDEDVMSQYKPKGKEVYVPTEEDVDQLLSNIQNIKNEKTSIMYTAIVKLFLGSGIRLDELVGLNVSDLHFEDKNNRYITITGKGEYDYLEQTSVYINQAAYEAVVSYLDAREFIDGIENEAALFVSKERRRLSLQTIQKFFKYYSDGKIHPHALRHYVGTKIYQNSGFDINKVKAQLRHKSIETSMKYYVAEDREGLKNVLDSF